MLRTLNEISRIQVRPTKDTMAKAKWFLDYAATYPNAIIRYHAIKMVLHIEYGAAYLVMSEARSLYAGYYYLSNWPRDNLISHPSSVMGQFSPHTKLVATLFLHLLKLKL